MDRSILERVQAGELTADEAVALMNAPKPLNPTFKVSEKGAISIYGLGQRFPVTMYLSQMEAVLDRADEIRAFIEANRSKLTTGKKAK